jgi:hypothetical protein
MFASGFRKKAPGLSAGRCNQNDCSVPLLFTRGQYINIRNQRIVGRIEIIIRGVISFYDTFKLYVAFKRRKTTRFNYFGGIFRLPITRAVRLPNLIHNCILFP